MKHRRTVRCTDRTAVPMHDVHDEKAKQAARKTRKINKK